MSKAQILVGGFPIVVLACPAHIDEAWVESLGAEVRRLYARRERYAFITDTTRVAALPGARERRMLADWAASPDELASQKTWSVGSATIIRSTVVRGAMQALWWFWTPPTPQHVARDLDDAWAFCLSMLEKERIALPRPAPELLARVRAELGEVERGGARGTDAPQ